MQVKGMGQGAKTRTVRLRTVLDLKGILEVGGWRSEPVGLWSGCSVKQRQTRCFTYKTFRASNMLLCVVTLQDWEKVCSIYQKYLSQSPYFQEHLVGQALGSLYYPS